MSSNERDPGQKPPATADPIDPSTVVDGCAGILDASGGWPNFHDAEVTDLVLWHGDVRPDDGVFIGPRLSATLLLWALETPLRVTLTFEDCADIELRGFDYGNAIMDLELATEPRGHLNDGRPLTPFIVVRFVPAGQFTLSLKCFRVTVRDFEAVPRTGTQGG